MLNLGFAADVGEVANRRFKRWGETGYIFGVLAHSSFGSNTSRFRIGCRARPIGTGDPACFSHSATANSPAAK